MISVITATFNRGFIIKTLYMSLRKQTHKDFEWIVDVYKRQGQYRIKHRQKSGEKFLSDLL